MSVANLNLSEDTYSVWVKAVSSSIFFLIELILKKSFLFHGYA